MIVSKIIILTAYGFARDAKSKYCSSSLSSDPRRIEGGGLEKSVFQPCVLARREAHGTSSVWWQVSCNIIIWHDCVCAWCKIDSKRARVKLVQFNERTRSMLLSGCHSACFLRRSRRRLLPCRAPLACLFKKAFSTAFFFHSAVCLDLIWELGFPGSRNLPNRVVCHCRRVTSFGRALQGNLRILAKPRHFPQTLQGNCLPCLEVKKGTSKLGWQMLLASSGCLLAVSWLHFSQAASALFLAFWAAVWPACASVANLNWRGCKGDL